MGILKSGSVTARNQTASLRQGETDRQAQSTNGLLAEYCLVSRQGTYRSGMKQ